MKTKQNLSLKLYFVKCMVVATTTVILSAGITDAGPRFNPKDAKGGLPVCLDMQNAITEDLEACKTNLVQAQKDYSQQLTDLETCNTDLEQLLADLTICEENGASSSLVIGVPKTGQIISEKLGDDGDLQTGTAWPDPRFTDNDDGTITDNMTGLVWTKNANIFSDEQTWYAAVDSCAALADDGIDLEDGSITGDWRLPNVRELNSLVDYGQSYGPVLPDGHPFVEVQAAAYWTSTTYSQMALFSWIISLETGHNAPEKFKDFPEGFVWCVRDGQ